MSSARASSSLLLLAGLALACSTRRPTSDAAAAPPAIEVRGPRGELVLSLAPRAVGHALRLPGEPQLLVRASAEGAEVLERDGRALRLRPGPGGLELALPDGRRQRVTVAGDRVTVIDAAGIIQLSVDGTFGRDGAGRVAHTIEPGGDRLLVLGPAGERLGTVHNLPAGPIASLLAAGGVDPRARAAVAAFLLQPPRM